MLNEKKRPNLLLLGSDVKVNNLPIKEVSLLSEGSLPAYGYNPGDFIELLAGKVSVENGRLEQCLTWLASYLASADMTPRVRTLTYGEPKEIFQIFRNKGTSTEQQDHGWFMVHQILPPEGRRKEAEVLEINAANIETLSNNNGILIIDDGGSCQNISKQKGVDISIMNGVITIFVPEMYANMSAGNMLITRGEYGSVKRTGVAGTEYCFKAMVNGGFFSEECIVAQ